MEMIDIIKNVRRKLHNNPEASGCEEKTKNIIVQFLADNTDLDVKEYKGGIIAFYDSGDAEKTIAFRADMDAVALPDGTAKHLCGHDGHTAALLGVALMIEKIKPARNVLLIFQPAEENGEGAKSMADVLDEYRVCEVYGAHNLPGFEFGKVYTSLDTFACASCGMTFYIKGSPAHAAYPENGNSPMKAVAKLFSAVEESQSGARFAKGTFATLIGCNMGQKAFGTSAENAEIWITVRSRTEKEFRRIKEYLEYTVKNACECDGLSYTLEIQDEFPATVNHVDFAKKVIEKCNGRLLEEPMRWSEDFGYFLNSKSIIGGAFLGVGAGECENLHTKDYEYPEDLLEYQIDAFIKLI